MATEHDTSSIQGSAKDEIEKIQIAMGAAVADIALAARVIEEDAVAQLHHRESAHSLAIMLEEARERAAIAHKILVDLTEALCRRYGVGDCALSPREKAAKAFGIGAFADSN